MLKIENLKENCYIPYSRNAVIAIVESIEGSFYPGVRVENLAFPLTVSAIQNAVFCCLSEGETPSTIFVQDKRDGLTSFWVEEYNLEVEAIENITEIDFAPILLKPGSINKTLQLLLKKALVDHSQFPVACLLEIEKGYISGVNIENNNWSCGLCAERVALGKAFSYGMKEFKSIHISTERGEYCSPCGACRQVLIEHLPQAKAHLHHPDNTTSVHFCADLLPYSFQSSSLKKLLEE